MLDFEYYAPTKVFFGRDKEKLVGEIIKSYGYKTIMLMYGKGSIKSSGLYDTVTSSLKENNINVIMVTGDNEKTANIIAEELEIQHVISNLLPKDKANKILELKKSGKKVMMVGDGINDAPALTRAHIGVAIIAY